MSKLLTTLGGGTGAGAAAAVTIAVVAGGFYVQSTRNAAQEPVPVALAEPTAPAEQAVQTQVETQQPQDTAASTPDDIAPAFDEVRRGTDGVTVIAGRAAPGAQVGILQNGVAIAQVRADAAGKFAAIAQIDPDGKGHVLSLLQQLDGRETGSLDEIILTPMRVAAAPDQPELAAQEQSASSSFDTADAADAADTADARGQTLTAALPAQEVVPPPAAQAAQAAQAAVLKSTAQGVELLNTPSPQAMTNVALDTISYSGVGAVELAGRAQSDSASVRVYLDNASVVDMPVDAEGRWRGELPNVDEGIYTLRVDEVSASGSVTSRVETPFKRESAQVLAAAAQDGPLSVITVQEGATLWAIARDRYGDGALYVRVFEANSTAIGDPDLIYPGQVFELPQ